MLTQNHFIFHQSKIREVVARFRETGVWILKEPTSHEMKLAQKWEAEGLGFITPLDPDFPEDLLLVDPPCLFLSYRGNRSLLSFERKRIAVVGSRTPSEHAIFFTRAILEKLPKELVVVSGLARGIDALAHRQWIGSHQIAVVPSGLQHVYPSMHEKLAQEILQNGSLLLSPVFPDLSTMQNFLFFRRNGVIAAITHCSYSASCGKPSGALMTLGKTASLGKPIFTVPDDPRRSSGILELCRMGAHFIFNEEPICRVLGVEPISATSKTLKEDVRKKQLESALLRNPNSWEGIAECFGITQDQVRMILTKISRTHE